MAVFTSRDKLFKYFNKHSSERKDELDRHKTNSPLLKSYTIETSSDNDKESFIKEIGSSMEISEITGDIFEIDNML